MEPKEPASGLVLGRHIGCKFKKIIVRGVNTLLQNAKNLGNSGVPRGVDLGGSKPPFRNSEDPPKSCQTRRDCENC